jgi:hypothetical protein
MKKKLRDFTKEGFFKLNNILSTSICEKVYKKILNERKWSKNLFLSENEFKKIKNFKKTNPGKNVQNLANKYDLQFITKNKIITSFLIKILGKNYKILLTKFVVAVPKKWMPAYVKKLDKINPLENFNKFIKKKYRDVTYFRGLDFHMDSIDWQNKNNKFITMYIYLNDVNKNMSPLQIVKKSHKLGHTTHPHYIKNNKINSLYYGKTKNKCFKFKKETLTGPIGSVYFWTSNTIHGTAPQKKNDENFRVSLRFIIEKNKKSRGLIDKIINQSKIGKVRENK